VIDSTALLICFDSDAYLILEGEERTVFAVPFVQSFRQETVAPVLALSTSSNSIYRTCRHLACREHRQQVVTSLIFQQY